MSFRVPERYRQTSGMMATNKSAGNNGAFIIKGAGVIYFIIASDGSGWEHVSVTKRKNNSKEIMPTWADMCYIKNLFWDDEDCVVQFHPPQSEYINNHPKCLHLWRKTGENFETPPKILVGI